MEIRIKTAEEFRDAHVTIEVNGIRVPLDARVERLYTPAEVGAAQASEAELVAAPLRRRVTELEGEIRRMDDQISGQTERAGQLDRRNAQLTEELIRRTHERDEREKARANLEAETNERIMGHVREADRLRTKIRELDRRNAEIAVELARERERATDNREWAERAESRLAAHAADLKVAERKLDRAEHTIETLSDQLGRIFGAVHSPEIVKAMNPMYCAPEIAMLRKTIDQVRDALGSSSLPEDADGPTSQA